MKYIDADRLKAEIERRIGSIELCPFIEAEVGAYERREGEIKAYKDCLSLLNSLQQEQPCDTCTNDKGCVTCKDGELWEGKEQPSGDLEAEMDRFFEEMPVQEQENIFEDTYQMIARHFYELGKQAKKEE